MGGWLSLHPPSLSDPAPSAGSTEGALHKSSRHGERSVKKKGSVNDGADAKPGSLLIKNEDQTVTGLLKRDGGQPQKFEYSCPENYDIAAVLYEADIPFEFALGVPALVLASFCENSHAPHRFFKLTNNSKVETRRGVRLLGESDSPYPEIISAVWSPPVSYG